MVNCTLDIVDDQFSKRSSLSYELSVLVGKENLYYLVNDAQLNVLALRSYSFDRQDILTVTAILKKVFMEDQILNLAYRVSKVAFMDHRFTLIPGDLFDEDCLPDYFVNVVDSGPDTQYLWDKLSSIDAVNVYQLSSSTISAARSYFSNIKAYHYMTPLILGFRKMAELQSGPKVYMNIRDQWLQVLYFEGHQLVLANHYAFKNATDIVYYSMMIFDQFKLNPGTVPVTISGGILPESEIYQHLYRYVRHLNLMATPAYYRLGPTFSHLQGHLYFDLFSIKMCD